MEPLRADVALTRRGLASSREKARRLIAAGLVKAGDQVVRKPSEKVAEDCVLTVLGEDIPYVSRGGLKLEKALASFCVDPTDAVCMDIGASTGGFTDVLLQRGAAHVYAIDVGSEQLDDRLRRDPRVSSMEHVNARVLEESMFPVRPQLAVMDVSFISIRLILPAALKVLGPSGRMISLVKPQFEAGKARIGKGGIVSSAAVHEEVLRGLAEFVPTLGWRINHLDYSPIAGGDGNIEFLADIVPASTSCADFAPLDIAVLVRQAHAALRQSGGK